jgi:hypothetical protein
VCLEAHETRVSAVDDRRKSQTSTATPAEPGDLPWRLVVLTVTAISLAAIALENSGVLPAHAQAEFMPTTRICSAPLSGRGVDCAQVVNGAVLVRAQ